MRSRLRLLLGLSLPVITGCPDGGGQDGSGPGSDTEDPTMGSATMGPGSDTEGETDTITDSDTDAADTTAGETDGECGNGEIEPGEQCDDGNLTPGDGCDASCQAEGIPEDCGDGTTDPGEDCDDGNNDPGDGCSPTCELEMPEACGNGMVDAGEQCDDGNNDAGDGCSPTCQDEVSASCGDGTVDPGEDCDDGNADDSDECLSSCTAASCGDGVVWVGHETCDDGNTTDGDDCSAACISELCGNGAIDLDEQCDNGGANGTPGNECFETCIDIDADFDMPLVFDLDTRVRGILPYAIEAGDFNGDGIVDLATVNNGSNDATVLHGFGDGRFWTPHLRETGTTPHDVELGDLDGDGRLDAVTANEGSDDVSVFLGGGAAFEAGATYSVQFSGVGFDPRAVALADVDGDGDLDIVSANQDSNTVSILTNNGAGVFAPTSSHGTFVGVNGMGPNDVKVADVTNDGELDIVTCNPITDDVSLLVGLGGGSFGAPSVFTTRVGAGGDDPEALVLADVTGDGVPDAIVASPTSDDVVVLVANPGASGFNAPVRFITLVGADGDAPQGLDVGDVDGDGEPDVVTANFNTNDVTVLMGVGGGATFEPAVVYPIDAPDVIGTAGDRPRGVRLADMDADGDLDVVTSNTISDDVTVLLNDGTGVFGAPMIFESSTGYDGTDPRALSVGDVNGDGVLDVVVSNQDTADITVVAGLGTGALAPAQTVTISVDPRGIAVGDVTGDGRLDWMATQYSTSAVRRATQGVSGQFFTANYSGPTSGLWGLSLGDIDGDADLDYVTAGYFDDIVQGLNTGGGGFSYGAYVGGVTANPVDLELHDVTGDGLLDIVAASTTSDEIRVYTGNGAGSFAAPSSFTTAQSTSGQSPWSVAVADVTGDGLMDVMTANRDSNDVSLLTNAGGGIYMPPIIIPATFFAGVAETSSVRLGDFDGDGELDLATSNRLRDTVSIVFGFGGGSFSAPQEFMVGSEPNQLAVGDFDGDGLDDVATVDGADGTVTVLLSQGH